MPTDTERDAAPVRHPIAAPPRLVGPSGLTRAGLEAQQAADVDAEAARRPCDCRTIRDADGDLVADTCACDRHGTDADARRGRGTFLCECGREETTAHALTVTWAGGSVRLCRVCSTCASCRRRAEVVDGDLCAACADARDAALEHAERAREGLAEAMQAEARIYR